MMTHASKVTVYITGALREILLLNGFAPLERSAASKWFSEQCSFQTTPSPYNQSGAQDWAGFLTGSLTR